MITIELTPYDKETSAIERAAKKLGVSFNEVRIVKKSIDARHKNNIKIIYSLDVKNNRERVYEKIETKKTVAVIGAGPAGLFSALTLCRHGVKPIIFERGDTVDNRTKAVEDFCNGKPLNVNCNVQFGEGGAGTFSDGKLNTGVTSTLISDILQDFVDFGAPDDILYLNKPHVGSDKLKSVVKNMRKTIESLGGTFNFKTTVDGFNFKNDKIVSVTANGNEYPVSAVILAIGHSARDTFERLYAKGVAMESKAFAVGLRVEQLQGVINADRYGKFKDFKTLPPADYKLVSHASDRSVFTFCMCPGGEVMPAASEEGRLVVNGMSNYLRNGKNANSAVVAEVRKTDFPSQSPLAGVEFQRLLESRAYTLGGGDFCAPAELCSDFISGNAPTPLKGVYPTYRRGFRLADLSKIFPSDVTESLKKGLYDMDGKIKGFASNGAVLTGVESRTSSPLRILRNENYESVSHKGLYPCGEGCGYAGGITSAALDGVKVANSIIEKFKNDCEA